MYYFIVDGKEIEYTKETSELFNPDKYQMKYRDEGVPDEVIKLGEELLCAECDFYCGCKVCEKFRPASKDNYIDEDENGDVWII